MAQKTISAVSVTSFEYGIKALRRLAKAQANIIEEVQVNGTKVNPDAQKKVNISVPTNLNQLNNEDTDFQSGAQVDAKVAAAISSTYKPAGTKSAEEILPALLVKANEGKVYNLTTALTITDETKQYWVENEAKTIPAGANIGVIEFSPADDSDPENPVAAVYKFDALQGLQDLSGYLTPNDITVTDVSTSDIDSWINGND